MKPVSSKLLYGYICQLVMDILPTTFCIITLEFCSGRYAVLFKLFMRVRDYERFEGGNA